MRLVAVISALVLIALSEGAGFWENRRVNCGVSLWSDWHAPARLGTHSRTRTVIVEPRNGGTPCPSLTETQTRRGAVNGIRGRFQIRLPGRAGLVASVGGGGNELTILPRDLLILIDSSGGIQKNDWTTTKQKLADLIENICGSIGPGKQNNRIAIITFSSRVELKFDFKTHWTTASARQAILNLPQQRRATCTGDALDYAHRYMFEPNTGIRTSTESVKEILILTDGNSNCGVQLDMNIGRLQVKALLFALEIGTHGTSGEAEIDSMVSRPLSDHIFSRANFLKFKRMVDIVRTYPATCAPFELT